MKKLSLILAFVLCFTSTVFFSGCNSFTYNKSTNNNQEYDNSLNQTTNNQYLANIQQDPNGYYLIYTAEEFVALFGDGVIGSGIKAKLCANIDLTDVAWSPRAVTGLTLDGQGYKILNLTINSKNSCGLFSEIKGFSNLSNIIIENAKINTSCSQDVMNVGAICGKATGSFVLKNCIMRDSEIVCTINEYESTFLTFNLLYLNMGGFVGALESFTEISNLISINNEIKCVPFEKNATFSGTALNEIGDYNIKIGGIIGSTYQANIYSKPINSCLNASKVSAEVNLEGLYDKINAGGIIGYTNAKIQNCQNNGEILAGTTQCTLTYAGGIAGYSTSSITNCLNSANIKAMASLISGYGLSGVKTAGYVQYDDKGDALKESKILLINFPLIQKEKLGKSYDYRCNNEHFGYFDDIFYNAGRYTSIENTSLKDDPTNYIQVGHGKIDPTSYSNYVVDVHAYAGGIVGYSTGTVNSNYVFNSNIIGGYLHYKRATGNFFHFAGLNNSDEKTRNNQYSASHTNNIYSRTAYIGTLSKNNESYKNYHMNCKILGNWQHKDFDDKGDEVLLNPLKENETNIVANNGVYIETQKKVIDTNKNEINEGFVGNYFYGDCVGPHENKIKIDNVTEYDVYKNLGIEPATRYEFYKESIHKGECDEIDKLQFAGYNYYNKGNQGSVSYYHHFDWAINVEIEYYYNKIHITYQKNEIYFKFSSASNIYIKDQSKTGPMSAYWTLRYRDLTENTNNKYGYIYLPENYDEYSNIISFDIEYPIKETEKVSPTFCSLKTEEFSSNTNVIKIGENYYLKSFMF